MAHDSSIIFITGGVRSGKSQFAEKLAAELWQTSGKGCLHYIAAMQPSDMEMKQRIARHQEGRLQSGLDWQTWEQSVSIGELAPAFNRDDVVLLDCLTTWLNNELFFSSDRWGDESFRSMLFAQMVNGLAAVSQQVKAFIIVSNEVLYEPVGTNELILVYSGMLGKLHQYIVRNCQQAFLVEMGLPVLMKGETVCGE